jgi:hypothetical protein
MGLFIIGIIAGLVTIAGTIALLADGDRDGIGAFILGGILTAALIIGCFGAHPKDDKFIVSKTENYIQIVPVNGFILYQGKYVLENNERGVVGDATIAVDTLSPTTKAYIKKVENTYGANFWHFAGTKGTKEQLILKKE